MHTVYFECFSVLGVFYVSCVAFQIKTECLLSSKLCFLSVTILYFWRPSIYRLCVDHLKTTANVKCCATLHTVPLAFNWTSWTLNIIHIIIWFRLCSPDMWWILPETPSFWVTGKQRTWGLWCATVLQRMKLHPTLASGILHTFRKPHAL